MELGTDQADEFFKIEIDVPAHRMVVSGALCPSAGGIAEGIFDVSAFEGNAFTLEIRPGATPRAGHVLDGVLRAHRRLKIFF
jgi:Ni,Fe-hydrogenase III small subunit